MSGIHVCVTCDEGTSFPDEHWLSLTRLRDAVPTPVTACSPRCLVLWLEKTYRPTALGVAL